jgi:hypothetical protein
MTMRVTMILEPYAWSGNDDLAMPDEERCVRSEVPTTRS